MRLTMIEASDPDSLSYLTISGFVRTLGSASGLRLGKSSSVDGIQKALPVACMIFSS